jgi:signal transduction histidine kinase
MLRHLVATQEKLRKTNKQLDGKVDELAQLNMQLYETNRIKSDFMATMSHELRTPLNSILGFSDVLGSISSLDDKQKRYVNNINKSGRTLLNMINDILDMAKLESGRSVVQPTEFRIERLVSAQCDMARPLADRKNIDLVTDLPRELPKIWQDESRIGQIINNLLSNAIKFTPEGGRIRVEVRRFVLPETTDGNGAPSSLRGQEILQMKFIDTGVGITEEDIEVIFEKFRQGTSSTPSGDAMKREHSGSGLGLSIVKELCKLLSGEISVESELGVGSTFTVRLPWHLEPKPKIESPMMIEIEEFSKAQMLGQFKSAREGAESSE